MHSHLFSSLFFFFKQKTAYEMRISDWSSDVCSSDLSNSRVPQAPVPPLRDNACQIPCDRQSGPPRHSCSPEPRIEETSGLCADHDRRATTSRTRSEERRVGKECVSTFRTRRSSYH